jgi:hypothetical protein
MNNMMNSSRAIECSPDDAYGILMSKPKAEVHGHDAKLTYRESKSFPWSEIGGEYAMLCIIQGAVSNSSNDFPKHKKRVAVQMVRRRTSHDDSSAEMERSQYRR